MVQRIDSDGSVNNLFVPADASIGQVATEITADWLNAQQEEDVNLVLGAGLALNPADNTQLLQAVLRLAGRRRNRLINGDFQLWQRAASHSFSTSGQYTADRWYAYSGASSGTCVVARQGFAHAQTEVPGDPVRYLVFNRSTGNASGAVAYLRQRIEDVRTLNGRVATVSVYMALGTGGGLATSMVVTPKLTQHFGSGGTSDVNVTGSAFIVTTTWTRFDVTFNVPGITGTTLGSGANYLELRFELPNATNYILKVADAQFTDGNVGTAFDRRPLAEELDLARRFYAKSYELDTDVGTADYLGSITGEESGTAFQSANTRLAIPMRAVPTVTWYSPDSGNVDKVYWAGADRSVSSTSYSSTVSTGFPVIGASQSNTKAFAHWTADAEI